MRGRRKAPAAPLPQRDGIDAVRVRLPEDPDGAPDTVGEYLVARFGGAIGGDRVAAMLDEGRFVGPTAGLCGAMSRIPPGGASGSTGTSRPRSRCRSRSGSCTGTRIS
ncbi:hypothetical protein Smic_13220 [Streptomyces microflavus]|uniref:Uncharacterized protein n=1 Tax=Streptomyces microflavus TaxID=1919 RepID=A0A7J0CJV4_STRMI|nr:hypothetical protein Smic_13220 [Streptomyces microflavus]